MKLNRKNDPEKCLELKTVISRQIFHTEAVILRVFYISVLTMAYFLVVRHLERSMTIIHMNSLLADTVSILLMVHTICINVNLGGAAKQFN